MALLCCRGIRLSQCIYVVPPTHFSSDLAIPKYTSIDFLDFDRHQINLGEIILALANRCLACKSIDC